jgi:hypothetical protein
MNPLRCRKRPRMRLGPFNDGSRLRCDDIERIDHRSYALDLGGDGLGDLHEVIGGEAATEAQHTPADATGDIAERQIAATPEAARGLPVDALVHALPPGRTSCRDRVCNLKGAAMVATPGAW